MPLTNKQYDAIMREYDRRQYHNYRIQCARKDEIYQKIPRIREIEESISSFSMAQAEKLFLSEERDSADPNALEDLRRGLASLRQDRAACLSALRHILPVMKEPWAPQACPLYRHMGDGDLTALAQSLYDRIIEDLEHSEEFAFFRGSPEYEQLRPILKEMSNADK